MSWHTWPTGGYTAYLKKVWAVTVAAPGRSCQMYIAIYRSPSAVGFAALHR